MDRASGKIEVLLNLRDPQTIMKIERKAALFAAALISERPKAFPWDKLCTEQGLVADRDFERHSCCGYSVANDTLGYKDPAPTVDDWALWLAREIVVALDDAYTAFGVATEQVPGSYSWQLDLEMRFTGLGDGRPLVSELAAWARKHLGHDVRAVHESGRLRAHLRGAMGGVAASGIT